MRITQFEGMAPQVDPSRLDRGLAEDAINAAFERGTLTVLPLTFAGRAFTDLMPTQTGTLTRAGGLFYSHMADAWFAFGDTVRRGVDSLIAPQDTWDRIYFAGSTGVRYMTSDQYTREAVNLAPTSYRLGVPVPAQAPAATKNSETLPAEVSPADVVRQRVFYVFTLVDDHGHEGPPSLASGGVDVPVEYPFQVTVTLSNTGNDTNARAFSGNARKRIYRSTSSSQGAAYQFVGEVAYTAGSFVDTVEYGQEAEVIPTETWYEPPAEIDEIDAVASNFLAGFYDAMVCFSEVKLPHAWPYAYRFPLKYRVVAIRSTANGLFIGTTGKPYWAYGADPQAAIPQELDYDLPCLSRASVADVGGSVVYASHDGLVAIDGQSARVVTEGYFTERDWKALDPATITAFAHEGRYIFHSPAAGEVYALDPQSPRTLTRIAWPGALATALDNLAVTARDERRDRTLFAVGGTSGPVLVEAINDPAASATWKGPVLRDAPRHYTFGQVLASAYPVTLTITAGTQTQTINVADEGLFRLPSWGKEREWQVQIDLDSGGDDRRAVYALILARSAEELRRGP